MTTYKLLLGRPRICKSRLVKKTLHQFLKFLQRQLVKERKTDVNHLQKMGLIYLTLGLHRLYHVQEVHLTGILRIAKSNIKGKASTIKQDLSMQCKEFVFMSPMCSRQRDIYIRNLLNEWLAKWLKNQDADKEDIGILKEKLNIQTRLFNISSAIHLLTN